MFPCELSLNKTYLDVERLITVSSLCFFGSLYDISVLEHQLKKQISSCYECRERYSGVIAYCSTPLLPTLVLCPWKLIKTWPVMIARYNVTIMSEAAHINSKQK